MNRPPGRVITFYSYKGGTGRSMALANVAWILACNGKRVLAIDWDLEAPGLHRYFRPFLIDDELASSDGLIDLIDDYANQAISPVESNSKPAPDWYVPYADFSDYVLSVNFEHFPKGGKIDLLPAGRQSGTYAIKINTFNWQNFYDRLGGGGFFEAVKQRACSKYDYVLIDSRTGVSDTAGICTVQMPDSLVVCFTYNNQSIKGAAAVARSSQKMHAKLIEEKLAHRQALAAERKVTTVEDTPRPYRVFPVPMRVDSGESDRLLIRQSYARASFSDLVAHLGSSEIGEYWSAVEVPQKVFYSYEEVLAPFKDEALDPKTVLAAFVRLTRYLTHPELTDYRLPIAPEVKQNFLEAFAETPLTAKAKKAIAESQRETEEEILVRTAETALAGLAEEERFLAVRVFGRLVRLSRDEEGGGYFPIRTSISDFGDAEKSIIARLSRHGLVNVATESRPSQQRWAGVKWALSFAFDAIKQLVSADTKKTIFVSYDYENDKHYKNLLVAWDANKEFDFSFYDGSVTVAIDSTDADYIKGRIRQRISASSHLLFLVGKETHKSKWVDWEIRTAIELKKKLIAVKIDKDNMTPPALLSAASPEQTVGFADERLLKLWKPLLEWLATDRGFLIWRQQLRAYLADWERSGREHSALLSGRLLTEADLWLLKRADDLNTAEISYIQASRDFRPSNDYARLAPIAGESNVSPAANASVGDKGLKEAVGFHRRRAWVGVSALVIASMALIAILLTVFLPVPVDIAQMTGNTPAQRANEVDQLIADAERSSKAGDLAAAVAAYRKAATLDPRNLKALLGLGRAYDRIGDFSGSSRMYEQAIAIDPPNPEILFSRGSSRVLQRDFKNAFADFDQAIELDNKNPAYYFGRGLAREGLSDPKGAIGDYSEAIRWKQEYVEAYLNRARLYEKTGATRGALADYQSVLTLPAVENDARFATERIAVLRGRQTAASSTGPHVFLQYNDRADEKRISELRKALTESLRTASVSAPELVSVRSAPEVRYFFSEDDKFAQQVKDATEFALAKQGVRVTLKLLYRDAKKFPRAKQGTVEVWLPSLSFPRTS